MKKQLLFLLGDIKSTWFHFCINLLQLTAGLMLFCYVLTTWQEFRVVKGKIRQATENTEIYMFRDNTSDRDFDKIINGDVSLKRLGELYDYIQDEIRNSNKETDMYLADSSMKFYYPEGVKIPKGLGEYNPKSYSYSSNKLSVTCNFFDVFQLQLDDEIKGIELTDDFVFKEGQDIPVILGRNFREVYKINDKFQDMSGERYRVIGFLGKASNYVAPDESRKLLSLDNFIITPQLIDKSDSISIVRFIQNLYIMSNKKEVAEKIADYSRSKDLFDLSVINFSYQLDYIISDTEDEIFINSVFMLIILIFTCVGIIGNLLQFIVNSKKEFAINLLCGAKKTDIIFRILLQIIVMFIIGIITVFLVFGISSNFCITVLFAILFISAIMVYPVYLLKCQTITTMIRRSYE